MEPFPSPSSFWFRTEKFYFQAGGSENRGLPAHGPGLGSALRSHVILGSRHSLPVSGCSPAKRDDGWYGGEDSPSRAPHGF